jgi:glycosyltransferase involved in cell wall biosynthesis
VKGLTFADLSRPSAQSAAAPHLSVLLCTDADVFAGTERHILALASALRSENITAKIACPDPSPLADRAHELNIDIIPMPKRGQFDWRAALQIRRLVNSGQIQIIHAHNGRTALATSAGLLATTGHLVVSQHFLDPAHTRRRGIAALISRLLHHWINRRTDRFIAVSNAVADSMNRRDHLSNVTVIHNGLSPQIAADLRTSAEIRAEFQIEEKSPLIVCAARLEPEKDIASLITAMQTVRDQFPSARCIIAGKGTLQNQLQSQIENLNLQNHVQLLGYRTDTLSLMNTGDCFVLPSLAEPFGLVLLEAMALSKPVIATRIAGPLEIVDENTTGLLVPPSDPPALASAIIQLLRDPESSAAMGHRGRQRFEDHFTDQRMAAATAALYQEISHR